MDTITLKEYDSLFVKERRDAKHNIISQDDADALLSILRDGESIFKWGYKRITAQHWVGVISLKDLTIEILPKLASYCDTDQLRNVLTRMLLVSHQMPNSKEVPGNIQTQKNSLIEILISTFLGALEKYILGGLQHSYQKISKNINYLKGKILINKQFSKNILKPDKFWCRFSKFTSDNPINQFFKLCLRSMFEVTAVLQNKKRIECMLPLFEEMKNISKATALSNTVVFNSTNHRAEYAYQYGKLFLQNLYSTLNAGNIRMNSMLFDMNSLYETFIYKSAKAIYHSQIAYQQRGSYALVRDQDGRKYIALRPDLTLKRGTGKIDIIDTKWKIPSNFAKESDIYQMNTYSISIPGVDRVILLYPFANSNNIVGDYHFADKNGNERKLNIRTIDLLKCLNWTSFLYELEIALTN